MVAPQQIIKKNKGQGFTYYIQNCQVLQYGWHWAKFGVLCLELCVNKCKNWKKILQEKKTCLDLT